MKKILAALILVLALAFPSMATVSDTESPVKIYSSGAATEYTIPFDYISDSDITVTLVNISTGAETAQTLDVDYTIVDETVTYSVAPGSAYKVVLQRVTPYTQEASFSAGEAPPLTTYESAFDKLTYLVQDLDERVGRSILLPSSSSVTDIEWPDLVLNSGKLIRINSDGDGLEAIATVSAGSALDVTAYCDAADLADLHSWVTTSGITAPDLTNLADATSTPAANKVAVRDASSIVKGAELNMTGDIKSFERFDAYDPDSSFDIDISSSSAVGDVFCVIMRGVNISNAGYSKLAATPITGAGYCTWVTLPDQTVFDVGLPKSGVDSGTGVDVFTGSATFIGVVVSNAGASNKIGITIALTPLTNASSSIHYEVFFLKKG